MINPHNDKVYTYVYIKKAKQGYQIDIVATIDGHTPEIDTPFFAWSGTKSELMTLIFLMFKNPVVKDSTE